MENSETKTHWRKGDKSDYLMSWDLESELRATIIKVVRIQTKVRGQTGEHRVAYFKENLKPIIINVTNGNVIEKCLGTHLIQDWANINLPVIIYVQGGVKFGKDTVRALRIRPANEKQELTTSSPAYKKVVQYMKEGGNFDDVETKHILSEEIKTQILKDAV